MSLTNTPPAQQLVYVFGDMSGYEIETLRVAELRMELPSYLRFEDMTTGEISGTGPIPLIYGAVMPLLNQPDAIPGYCANLYLVEPTCWTSSTRRAMPRRSGPAGSRFDSTCWTSDQGCGCASGGGSGQGSICQISSSPPAMVSSAMKSASAAAGT